MEQSAWLEPDGAAASEIATREQCNSVRVVAEACSPIAMLPIAQPQPASAEPIRGGGEESAGTKDLDGPYEWECKMRCGVQQRCSREDSVARGCESRREGVSLLLSLLRPGSGSSDKTGTMAESMAARKLQHTHRKRIT